MMTTLPGLVMLNGWTMIIRYYGLVKLDIIWIYCNFSLYIFYWKDDITFGGKKFALRNVFPSYSSLSSGSTTLINHFVLTGEFHAKHYLGT